MNAYLVQIIDLATCPRTRWRNVSAQSHHDAITQTLEASHGAFKRLATRKPTLTVWVADATPKNRHKNGLPICVHRFTLQCNPS